MIKHYRGKPERNVVIPLAKENPDTKKCVGVFFIASSGYSKV